MSRWLGDCEVQRKPRRPDRLRVYILWGQSHIAGTKSFADGYPEAHWQRFGEPVPGCFIWDKYGRPNRATLALTDALRANETHTWKPLTAGFGGGGPDYAWEDPSPNPSFGPEMQFAHSLRASTGEGVGIIKLALGGTQVAPLVGIPNWNAGIVGAGNMSLLEVLIDAYWTPAWKSGVAYFAALGMEMVLGGVISMIGTSDARRLDEAQAYGANLIGCIDHLRGVLHPAHPESVPWLVVQSPRYVAPDGSQLAFISTVRAGQLAAQAARPGVRVRDSIDARLTGTHFEPRGTAMLGQLIYRWAVEQAPVA